MGFDVYGYSGNYFRANIWSWPSILSLIAETEILPHELVVEMGSHDGAEANGKDALKIADAIEKAIEGKFANQKIKSTISFQIDALGGSQKNFACETDIGHIKEFIKFCRKSEGFQIW